MNSQLVVNRVQVVFDGVDADMHLVSDLFIREPFGAKLENLALLGSQNENGSFGRGTGGWVRHGRGGGNPVVGAFVASYFGNPVLKYVIKGYNRTLNESL